MSLPTQSADPLAGYSIGVKLRALRVAKNLTLSRLAGELGLSTALLSKLETDRMVPTLPTLAKIGRVYGVDLAYFFAVATHHSLAITRNAYVVNERREQPTARETPLHDAGPDSKQVAKIVDMPAGATLLLADRGSRTQLTAYVLNGTVHMSAAGADEVLHIGDCFVLDTDALVTWTTTTVRCRVLAVFAK